MTLPLPGGVEHVAVKAAIEIADPHSRFTKLPDPSNVVAMLPLVFSPNSFVEYTGTRTLFEAGDKALARQLMRLAGSSARRSLIIGAEFIASVLDRGVAQDESVLSKTVRVAVALLTQDFALINHHMHEVRVAKSGAAKQLVRKNDKATAWRLYLTKRGAGWRLQFWHVPGTATQPDAIELANVLAEADPIDIPP